VKQNQYYVKNDKYNLVSMMVFLVLDDVLMDGGSGTIGGWRVIGLGG